MSAKRPRKTKTAKPAPTTAPEDEARGEGFDWGGYLGALFEALRGEDAIEKLERASLARPKAEIIPFHKARR